MKNLRGGRLIALGVILYVPYFIWDMVIGNAPQWAFLVSVVLFLICLLIGMVQIIRRKDHVLDEDMQKSMEGQHETAKKSGWLRLDR